MMSMVNYLSDVKLKCNANVLSSIEYSGELYCSRDYCGSLLPGRVWLPTDESHHIRSME